MPILRFFLLAPLPALLACAALFRTPSFLVIVLALAGIAYPYRGRIKSRWLPPACAAAGLALSPWLALSAVNGTQARVDVLADKLSRQGKDAFSREEKTAVYALAAGLALAGAPVYPEAAREQFHLLYSGPEKRRWTSPFAMRAPRVCARLRELAALLPAEKGDTVMLPRRTLAFPPGDPLRVALALNPFTLGARAVREAPGWRIEAVGTVPVKYPRRGRTRLPLPFGWSFYVEEGLFWMLQEHGWLHPYRAEWAWRLPAGELDD